MGYDTDQLEDDEIVMGPGCSICGAWAHLMTDPDGMVMCVAEIACMSRALSMTTMVAD